MKIVVLSLLRLGDLLMQRSLFADLRRRYPGTTIDVVVNSGSLKARSVMPEIDSWIAFDREGLQKKIGTAEIPLIAPIREMELFIEDLSVRSYDRLYNFTHNRLSGHLAEAIEAKEKFGLVAEGKSFRPFANRWLRHMNERGGARGASPFHSVEMLAGAFGLSVDLPKARSGGSRILLQPLTSDFKKNWSLENWKRLFHELRAARPGVAISVLGAPFEAEILNRHFEPEDLALATLGEVDGLLREASLLITGDTSIKHLAASVGTPILELALGSANPERTGAFQDGAVLLQGAVPCAPCPHSSPCRKLSHLCGEALSVETVLAAFESRFEMISPPIHFRQTRASSAGRAMYDPREPADGLADILEKNLWRAFLEGHATESAPAWGDDGDHRLALDFLIAEQERLELIVREATEGLNGALRSFTSGADVTALNSVRRKWAGLTGVSPRLRAHLQDLMDAGVLPFAHPLAFFGHARRAVEELTERALLRRFWIQSLMEHGGSHERVPGNVFERGPHAP